MALKLMECTHKSRTNTKVYCDKHIKKEGKVSNNLTLDIKELERRTN